MKTPFGKMISMVVLSVLLMAACDKPGTNNAIDQNGAPDENTAKGGGLKGLDSSHLIGKWEALETENVLNAKGLSISDGLTSEPVPTVATENSTTANSPTDVAQPSNSPLKQVNQSSCLQNPSVCPTICWTQQFSEGCQVYLNKHSCLKNPSACYITCWTRPYSEGCQAYLYKLKKPNPTTGDSQQPVQTEVSVPTMNLKMVIGESDLQASVLNVDTTNNMIYIRLEGTLQREDYYLIREVDGVTYFDICPCDAKECTPDNAKTCSAEFSKKIESGKPGQFKKL